MREMKDSGVEWIGEIPRHWQIIRFRFIAKITTGNQDTQNADPNGAYPFFVRSPIVERCNSYTFDGEGILMAGDGAGAGRVFHLANGKYAVHQRVYRFYDFKYVNPVLLKFYLENLFSLVMDYGSAKTTVPSVRLPMIQNFGVSVPPEEEQHTILEKISEKTEKVDALIQNVQTQIEKLKAYKQSLITEVVTKGLDPTVPMKDSGVDWIGEIPEKWQMRKANTLSERIVVGVVIRPSEYFDIKGTIPFLRGLNVKDYQISTENLVYITEQSNQLLSKSIVNEGDILIVRDGNIGASCIVPPELAGANVVSMIIFTPNSEITSPYICYCLNSLVGKHQFELTKIGSALTHTSVSAVSRLVFPLPAVEEQNSITAYLDKKCAQIDRLIAIKQAKIEKLEQYKRSLIYEYVTGKKEVS